MVVVSQDRFALPELTEKSKIPSYFVMSEGNSWNSIRKSKYIESILLNFPITPVVLYELAFNSYRVIDGKCRLKTILEFYNDEFKLTGLSILTKLEGHTYSSLAGIKTNHCMMTVNYKIEQNYFNKKHLPYTVVLNQFEINEGSSANLIAELLDRYD